MFYITVENLNGLQAILVDCFLNTETLLVSGANQIAFNIDSQVNGSADASRFAIKYTTGQLLIEITTFHGLLHREH